MRLEEQSTEKLEKMKENFGQFTFKNLNLQSGEPSKDPLTRSLMVRSQQLLPVVFLYFKRDAKAKKFKIPF